MLSNPDGLIGRVIGGFRLEQRLGTGATGAVFLGRAATTPQTPVAIKILILPWQLSEAERANFQARFRREAETLQRLRHPHILSIQGFGEEGDLAYMVLPYLEGGTLATRLANQGGPLPLNEVSYYLNQLAEALDYAHSQRIVHRDIKPGNVLLDRQWQVYLADFSIVRLVDAVRTNLTATGQVLGTPQYLAPEQMSGEEATPVSDIYSLGVVAYELVTGRVPFQGKSFGELFKQHLQDAPPLPRLLRQDLPEAAEAALLQALAKRPAERFSSAGAFAQAFALGLQGQWVPEVRRPGDFTKRFTPLPTSGPSGASAPPTIGGFTPAPTINVSPPLVQARPAAQPISPGSQPAFGQTTPASPGTGQTPGWATPAPVSRPPAPSSGWNMGSPGASPGAPVYPAPWPGTQPQQARRSRRKALLIAALALLGVVVAGLGVGVYAFTQNKPGSPGRQAQATGTTAASTETPTATAQPRPAAGVITEFPVPTAGSSLAGITAGPDGNLWFTEETAGQIGRITPQGAITEFPLPTGPSAPIGITSGPDGNLWFTELGRDYIGRITRTGAITEFALPTAGTFAETPYGIVAGPDGALWFTENNGNKIGRITTAGTITEFLIPTPNGGPGNIVSGPGSTLWFTEEISGKIGRIALDGTITEYPLSGSPAGITVGPDGNLWFTEPQKGSPSKIGHITPDGTVTESQLLFQARSITAGPDGNLWITEYLEDGTERIGRLTLAGTITDFPVPTPQSGLYGIAAGPDGNLWFTESKGNKIGRITSGQ